MSAVHPLISATELRALLDSPQPPLLLDCGFDLADTSAGEQDYQTGHLPGARYLHLDRDLSAPKSAAGPIQGGRHPLPSLELLAQRAGAWGVTPERLVVCYDRQGGPYAARAWWMPTARTAALPCSTVGTKRTACAACTTAGSST